MLINDMNKLSKSLYERGISFSYIELSSTLESLYECTMQIQISFMDNYAFLPEELLFITVHHHTMS